MLYIKITFINLSSTILTMSLGHSGPCREPSLFTYICMGDGTMISMLYTVWGWDNSRHAVHCMGMELCMGMGQWPPCCTLYGDASMLYTVWGWDNGPHAVHRMGMGQWSPWLPYRVCHCISQRGLLLGHELLLQRTCLDYKGQTQSCKKSRVLTAWGNITEMAKLLHNYKYDLQ